MKIRLFDNDNKIFEYIDLSDLEKSLEVLNSYKDYFSSDYLHEDYYDGKDVEEDIYRLPTLNRFYINKDNVDYYVGDKVLVNGNTQYETELIYDKLSGKITFKEIHFHVSKYVSPHDLIIRKTETIYDKYLRK